MCSDLCSWEWFRALDVRVLSCTTINVGKYPTPRLTTANLDIPIQRRQYPNLELTGGKCGSDIGNKGHKYQVSWHWAHHWENIQVLGKLFAKMADFLVCAIGNVLDNVFRRSISASWLEILHNGLNRPKRVLWMPKQTFYEPGRGQVSYHKKPKRLSVYPQWAEKCRGYINITNKRKKWYIH